ncbi:hypothetical protein LZ32DRAFT_100522 [Colletotrichum eremochloae]|nr:hypothetical protein LZ32DRAFT_100522 [Colletotrichum eremochloae]
MRRNGRYRTSSVIKVICSECPRRVDFISGINSVATGHTSRYRNTNPPLQSGTGVSLSLLYHAMLLAADGEALQGLSGMSIETQRATVQKKKKIVPLSQTSYGGTEVLRRAAGLEPKARFRRSNTHGDESRVIAGGAPWCWRPYGANTAGLFRRLRSAGSVSVNCQATLLNHVRTFELGRNAPMLPRLPALIDCGLEPDSSNLELHPSGCAPYSHADPLPRSCPSQFCPPPRLRCATVNRTPQAQSERARSMKRLSSSPSSPEVGVRV